MTQPYRSRSDETWARAREDYLAGLTAEQVCLRHDLGLRAFWNRAAAQGWRRIDQPDPAPDEIGGLAVFDDFEPQDLETMARLRMIAAMSRGQAAEANRWRRIYVFWQAQSEEMAAWQVQDEAEALAMQQLSAGQSAQSAHRISRDERTALMALATRRLSSPEPA